MDPTSPSSSSWAYVAGHGYGHDHTMVIYIHKGVTPDSSNTSVITFVIVANTHSSIIAHELVRSNKVSFETMKGRQGFGLYSPPSNVYNIPYGNFIEAPLARCRKQKPLLLVAISKKKTFLPKGKAQSQGLFSFLVPTTESTFKGPTTESTFKGAKWMDFLSTYPTSFRVFHSS